MRDVDIVQTELLLSDIDVVERRISKTEKLLKADRTRAGELELLKRLLAHLEAGSVLEKASLSSHERELLKDIPLLSNKPVLYAANISDDHLFDGGKTKNPHLEKLTELAVQHQSEVLPLSAKSEEELSRLPADERAIFMQELNIAESGLKRLISESYKLLGLISFFTIGESEVRAWTIPNGVTAPQAAGRVHSDFERGFIRAETVSFDDLASCGNMAAAKEKGLIRSEGREYVVKDADILFFRAAPQRGRKQ